ncbi:MAG: universal stress protein [Deltaproteobacteria bacterium]|nr:universal stress protein [Deltaproteobacteria bacterium]MBW2137373.1 universal stress protein [Deltaproteobacteria bacterium]
MIKKILVPVDGSIHSLKAVHFASTLAAQNDASVHLVHVTKRTEIPKAVLDFIRSEGIRESPSVVYTQYVSDQILIPAENEARARGIGRIEMACLQGDPAQEIISYASWIDCDLIVMGSRGQGAVKGLMMGSVSTRVCHGTDRTCVVVRRNILEDRRILVVDDEPDVLETLEELLYMCDVVKASTLEEGRDLLQRERFDIAILDIMGVHGYDLLKVAKEKDVAAVMLTAHALSPEDIKKSHLEGAVSYVPKDKMKDITIFLKDVLEAKEKERNPWRRWLERLGSYFDDLFGAEWKQDDPKFWDRFPYYYY